MRLLLKLVPKQFIIYFAIALAQAVVIYTSYNKGYASAQDKAAIKQRELEDKELSVQIQGLKDTIARVTEIENQRKVIVSKQEDLLSDIQEQSNKTTEAVNDLLKNPTKDGCSKLPDSYISLLKQSLNEDKPD